MPPLARSLFFPILSLVGSLAAVSAADAPPVSISEHVVWKCDTGQEITAAPVVADGVVYCGSKSYQFFAVDAKTGATLWKYQAPFPILSRAAVSGDLVCFESGSILLGLDRKTGKERWRFAARPFRPIYSMDLTDYHRSSPVIAGNVAYYGDDWGNLNGVDLATGALAFQYTTASQRPIRATPMVKDNVVYFGDWEGDVYAVSLSDRQLRWQSGLPNRRQYYGAVVSEFVTDGDLLYFGSQHDVFAPLELATGKPAWTYVEPKHTYLPTTPLVHQGKAIIATTIFTHSVLCLEQGAVTWAFRGEGIFFSRPLLHGSHLLINSSNFGGTGYLYVLDVADGRLINRLKIDKATASSPAFDGERIYLGAGDGFLYALDYPALIAASSVP